MAKSTDDTEQSAANARRDAKGAAMVQECPGGRVNGRTLVMMRWIAISGQLISIAVITELLKIALPIAPMLATVGASILLNVVVMAQRGSQQRLTGQDATFYLAFDTLELTLLLYLTGGMVNPFTILLLAPLTVGAAILSLGNICLLTLVNQFCLAVIAIWHFPLPWPGESPALPPLYLAGVWCGLAMASLMLASYVFRVAHESRRINDALTASQMALAREQRLSALGGLAAAAAHELGTPLGTIVVVAAELARDVPKDSPIAEDIALLRSQSLRCRDILAELARKPEADGGDPFERLPLTALVDAASTSHRATATVLRIVAEPLDGSPEPVVRRRPEIIHGIGNLLQNAPAIRPARGRGRRLVGRRLGAPGHRRRRAGLPLPSPFPDRRALHLGPRRPLGPHGARHLHRRNPARPHRRPGRVRQPPPGRRPGRGSLGAPGPGAGGNMSVFPPGFSMFFHQKPVQCRRTRRRRQLLDLRKRADTLLL